MNDNAYPDALPPQYRLHWYVLERVLGQGGFGITYLARDTNLDQSVAIKEYLPVDVATRRPDSTVRSRTNDQNERYRWGLDRFIREARTLARFDDSNIVRVHSVFEFNNTAYMVMRFEEGETLAGLLERRRTLSEADLVRFLLPVLDGLELVHGAGFIHRDIKPDNILIRSNGTPVLLDFGSARNALGHARTVTILVAPGYAPFEQYHSSGENQGPWTDIYGLGATCYRAIAGIAPMDAIARSKGILGSTREILVPASAIGSGRYSARLLKAIDHALEFAEKDRPQTIAEWRKEIAGGGHVATAPQPVASEVAASQAAIALPAHAGPARSAWSGAKGPVIWAVLGALVAAAAAAYWIRPGGDQRRVEDALARIEQDRMRLEQAKQKETEERRLLEEARKAEEERRIKEEAQRKERERKLLEEAQKSEPEREPPVAPKPAPRPDRKPTAKKDATPAEPKQPAAAKPVETASASPVPAPAPMAPAEPSPPVPQNDAESFTHYQRLAHQGSADAALKLAELYETGRGISQSNNWACSWYALAERRGASGAKSRKESVAKKLQPREIRQCDNWAAGQAQPSR
jgi:tRNA A-37 threonylcarbamoyl transferase component Bud32